MWPFKDKDVIGVMVSDFPKSEYKVYWETFYDEVTTDVYTATVRFIGYSPFTHRSEFTTTGASLKEVKERIDNLIKTTMQQFRK